MYLPVIMQPQHVLINKTDDNCLATNDVDYTYLFISAYYI